MSRPRAVRRFGLLDAIVLVGATAAALKLCMLAASANDHGGPDDFVTPSGILAHIRARGFLFAPIHLTYWAVLASPFLRAWSVALLVLALRRPRPGRRAAATRPGTAASLAVLVVVMGEAICWGLLLAPSLWGAKLVTDSLFFPRMYSAVYQGFNYGNMATGMAVAASWSLLGLGRRWRPDGSWLDRLGIGLGVIWLGLTPFYFWVSLMFH